MNWHFCIITCEKRALEFCNGSMNIGSGFGDGWGWGDGWGDSYNNDDSYSDLWGTNLGFGNADCEGDGPGYGKKGNGSSVSTRW